MKKGLFFVFIIAVLFSGCFNSSKEEKWTSWIFPVKENTKRSMQNGVFNTFKECKEASILKLKELNLNDKGTYKCGLNCTYHEGMKTEVCEKMTK